MDYQGFICNLSELFIFDDDVVNDAGLITWIMSLGEPSVSSILLMKDRGNSLFKIGNVSLASNLYKQALNFLCFVGFLPCCDQHATSSLRLSLVLNLAACELRLGHYDMASRYCKFVLHFDPTNVKSLYRRALAFKHLNHLNDALDDFEHVLRLDPKNPEASRELLAVVDQLSMKPNGKRVALPFDPLGSDNKGKKPLLTVDGAAKTEAVSCSTYSSTTSMISEASVICKVSEASSVPDSMLLDTFCESDPRPKDESSGSSNQSLKEESTKYSFSNKKKTKHQLHISSEDYEKLLGGKDLSFFHAGSLSFMRVQPLIPKNSIQTGTPHEDTSRAAEVPPASPLPKEQVEYSTSTLENSKVVQEQVEYSTSTLENSKVVQEEVNFQIDKKKRISLDSAEVSRLSAVKESKTTSCRRKVDYSRHQARVTQADVHVKKRRYVSVEFPHLICRYTTPKAALVTGAKRKEAHLFHFEDFYHSPYKKCRLSISCTFRSVTWISSSLKDSGTSGFVL